MKVKKTSKVNGSSFEDMREGFSGTNQAANEAQTEPTEVPTEPTDTHTEMTETQTEPTETATTNETVVEKRPANRIDEDEATERKKPKKQSSMMTTVDNGQKFNARIKKFVPAWGSNNALIVLANLVMLQKKAASLVANVLKVLAIHTRVLDKRFELFDPLEVLATRILNELKACGASAGTIAHADHYVQKLRGKRIIAIDPDETDENYISACQLSFSNQYLNFGALVDIVGNEALYDPLEDELKPVQLVAYHEAMGEATAAVEDSQADLDAARRERNKCFNEPVVGLVDVYQTAKAAAKARYGVTSAEFKSIKGLTFRRIPE